jgi:hypothetical protein
MAISRPEFKAKHETGMLTTLLQLASSYEFSLSACHIERIGMPFKKREKQFIGNKFW